MHCFNHFAMTQRGTFHNGEMMGGNMDLQYEPPRHKSKRNVL